VFGDIHGQYFDLVHILNELKGPEVDEESVACGVDEVPSCAGDHKRRKWLFLGDFVDRGTFGIETVLYLLSLKLHFPDRVFLLRGNHECRLLTDHFNFRKEVGYKYSTLNRVVTSPHDTDKRRPTVTNPIYEHFMMTFDTLPLAARIHTQMGRFFACHGGLSPQILHVEDLNADEWSVTAKLCQSNPNTTLEDLERLKRLKKQKLVPPDARPTPPPPTPPPPRPPLHEPPKPFINRFMEIPRQGPFADLLWSDPIDPDNMYGLSQRDYQEWFSVDFVDNPSRGTGYVFSVPALKRFLAMNNLRSVIRAHEVQKEGFYEHTFKVTDVLPTTPLCITVFSAPNYCDVYKNKGAVMLIDETHYSFRTFDAVPHPFCLPSAMNGIAYSLPFITEKAMEFITGIIKVLKPEEEAITEGDAKRRHALEVLRKKVVAVSKMQSMFRNIREQYEAQLKLKGLTSKIWFTAGHSLPSVEAAAIDFETAKQLDAVNEFIPPTPSDSTFSNADTNVQRNLARSSDFWRRLRSKLSTLVTDSGMHADAATDVSANTNANTNSDSVSENTSHNVQNNKEQTTSTEDKTDSKK
jgi:serine/threonine-protein phosphatase 2B catalytic subunit